MSIRVVEFETIRCQLLDDEFVKWLVFIEGFDHIISIRIRVRIRCIPAASLIPCGLRESGDVQPVSCPTLSIMWTFQQAINQLRKCLRGIICYECLDLVKRWCQADKCEVSTQYQGATVGCFVRCDSLGLQSGQNEIVDGLLGPVGILNRGRIDGLYGAVGPMRFTNLFDPFGWWQRFCGISLLSFGPIRAATDPCLKRCDLAITQFAFRRHFQIGIGIANRLDELALVRFAWDHNRAGSAALGDGN